ncbi:hypothetical protein CAPTEDRAFT_221159 [Capitella teleta]|uniref:BHLH domain-containing protein n=1 Tax=Capitella teleta TaxID=283909 RepID=R7V2J2_CAPTE|nr:hypothetical protein CAPTEDRAFT_221159 [Capitella teleta]|eukprot:ELU12749.1 hypothetical protein CAPTEDRAFT_221159 [Capitella teleta]
MHEEALSMSLHVGGFPPQPYPLGSSDFYAGAYPSPAASGGGGAYRLPEPGAPGDSGAYLQNWVLQQHNDIGAEYSYGQSYDYGGMGDVGARMRAGGGGAGAGGAGKRKPGNNNKKERRRTHSINSAFASLRGCIPNVPSDTKLSKIKTLRLATSYIAYLMDVLNQDDPTLTEGGFKAEITRKIESREDKRRREQEEMMKAVKAPKAPSKKKGRTGWPQQVWASELKT